LQHRFSGHTPVHMSRVRFSSVRNVRVSLRQWLPAIVAECSADEPREVSARPTQLALMALVERLIANTERVGTLSAPHRTA
jgi:hypothetical protein